MAAANYKLDNLTVFVDNNGLQIDGPNDKVMALGDLAAKFAAFGYKVIEVADGNDIAQVMAALDAASRRQAQAASSAIRSRARACPLWKIRSAGTARLRTPRNAQERLRNWRIE